MAMFPQKSIDEHFDDPELPGTPYGLPVDPSTGAWFKRSKTKVRLFCSFSENVVASRITGTC